MKNTLKILLAATLIVLITSCKSQLPCASEDHAVHFTYNNTKYEIIREQKNWSDAAACAVERGGYLAEIGSLSEQVAVFNALLLSGIPASYHPVPDGGGTSYVWIGAGDKNSEGFWIWDGNNDGAGNNFWSGQGAAGTGNGAAAANTFVNWGGASKGKYNEPDDYRSDQDAAAMALAGWPAGTENYGIAGEWNDINSSNGIYYIIEYGNASPEETKSDTSYPFTVSPDTCRDKLYVLYVKSTEELKDLKIYDTKGALVREYKDMPVPDSLDTGDLDGDAYIILAECKENRFYSRQFVKQ